MPTKIDPNYKPTERVYQLLVTRFPELSIERAREFVGHELPEMIMYFEGRTDQGALTANWNSTCLNWMKRAYENKRERQHGSHQASSGDDLFSRALTGVRNPEYKEAQEQKNKKLTRMVDNLRQKPPILPEYKDKTNPEDAFAQLRKEGVIR